MEPLHCRQLGICRANEYVLYCIVLVYCIVYASFSLILTLFLFFVIPFLLLQNVQTGLSPLVPGQWKSLLAAYATIYGLVQIIKPFRVAAAIAMSKLSKEFLDQTQVRLHCNKRMAVVVQYALGWVAWSVLAVTGIGVASTAAGVSIWKC